VETSSTDAKYRMIQPTQS